MKIINNLSNVLITGIGGASLGTEILKCLNMTKRYNIYGCDISNLAYGHYQEGLKESSVIDRNNYIESIINICNESEIDFLIPGGEEPMTLLNNSRNKLYENGIKTVMNSSEVINKFSNKSTCFKNLSELGFKIPLTMEITNKYELDNMIFPCIVKPSTGSGGSNSVFLAKDNKEAEIYVNYILSDGRIPIVQEYIPETEGEYTVGVLSLPNREIASSIALKRVFNSKLSILYKGKNGLISSGYSQGLIDEFPEICKISEKIATSINSECAINVQGRVKDGEFLPFEINTRISASTYLRALAGINEIDIYLQYLKTGILNKPENINYGYYMRTLTEKFIRKGDLK